MTVDCMRMPSSELHFSEHLPLSCGMKLVVPVALLVVAVPIAAIVTFLASPFWNWFEAKTGIESIGHSGPAGWCFAAVCGFTSLFMVAGWLCLSRIAKAVRQTTAGGENRRFHRGNAESNRLNKGSFIVSRNRGIDFRPHALLLPALLRSEVGAEFSGPVRIAR